MDDWSPIIDYHAGQSALLMRRNRRHALLLRLRLYGIGVCIGLALLTVYAIGRLP